MPVIITFSTLAPPRLAACQLQVDPNESTTGNISQGHFSFVWKPV